jgi:uncharacterized protein (DUF1810 family)
MSDDPYDLERFVAAQDRVYEDVRSELGQGRKTSHWMWFVFPILRGLGKSPTAVEYAIADVEEARAYWDHPVLGPRLQECVALTLAHHDKTAREIFQSGTDTWKFRNCLTLFASAVPDEPLFSNALDRFFKGDAVEESDDQS